MDDKKKENIFNIIKKFLDKIGSNKNLKKTILTKPKIIISEKTYILINALDTNNKYVINVNDNNDNINKFNINTDGVIENVDNVENVENDAKLDSSNLNIVKLFSKIPFKIITHVYIEQYKQIIEKLILIYNLYNSDYSF